MNQQCYLYRLPKQTVLSVRTRTTMAALPQVIGESYGKVMQRLGELGDLPADVPFTAYYNLDEKNLDVEMGFPTAERLSGAGDVQAGAIPACTAAVCIYKGAYAGMQEVYDGIFKFIEAQGRKSTGVYYEFYYNSPADVPESELITKIVLPLV